MHTVAALSRRGFTFTALAALVAWTSAAQAGERPQIDFERARVQPFALAIAPAAGSLEAGAAVADVLSADLDRSGLFKVIDPRSFLADAAKEGMTQDTIDFKPWTAVGAQGLVKLSAAQGAAGTINLELHLFDPARAAELLKGAYSAPPGGLRQLAHRIADDIVKFYTQEPGDNATRIAYVRRAAGGKQIVVADSDGANAQAVTGGGINLLPTWRPDGRALAFTSFRDNHGAHIFLVDVGSGAIEPLVRMGDFASAPAYAPDGTRFIFSASVKDNTDLYLSQSDGSAGRRLTDARGIDISATFSPDGKLIAFVSDRGGTPQIYVMNLDGSGLRRLTYEGRYNQEPAWSPKGDVIAFSGRDEHNVFDIFTVEVATGKIKRLTDGKGNSDRPAWSPTGRHLLFASNRTGQKQLWVMTADGQNQRQVTNDRGGASDPAWGPLPSAGK